MHLVLVLSYFFICLLKIYVTCHKILHASQYKGQCTIFRYLSHQRTATAQASLCICAGSPEPPLLAFTNYGCRRMLRENFRPHILLASCSSMFKEWLLRMYDMYYMFRVLIRFLIVSNCPLHDTRAHLDKPVRK